MNKKLLSTLMVSALIASATTSLTSCKDYDDDINNLQSQIDELKGLQEKIQKQIDNGAILTSVTPTGDGVVLALSNGNSYTIKNGVNGTNGIDGKDGVNGKDGQDGKNGSVVTIGENGNWFIDGKDTGLAAKGKDGVNGKDGLNGKDGKDGVNGKDGLNGKDGKDGVNGKDGLNGDYYVPNATTGKFDKYTYDAAQKKYVVSATDISFLAPGTITAVQDGDMLTLYGVKDAQGNAVPFVLDLSHKIASADLFLNTHENGADAFDHELTFTSVAEKANTFGDLKITDKVFEFKDGQYAVQGDSVLIRVNPTAVTLDKANIHLMNSQKKELDFVECTDVHRYTGLATRAVESGLWVVKFNLKSDFNEDALKAATETDNGKILYSVSIKDSKDSDPDARVVTDYDLTLDEQGGHYAEDFTVNKKSIKDIHNRYTACDDGTSTEKVPELSWKDATKPGTKAILEGNDANAVNRPTPAVDDRQDKNVYKILPVELGKDITIEYPSDKPIKGFYVTLDKDFALESAPSELNAWCAGEYTNVGVINKVNGKDVVVTKAHMFSGNTGVIRINSTKDVGDIIGFRVYAVNLDGTLVDPDGRAFYVTLGKDAGETKDLGAHEVTASAKADGSESGIFALTTTLENGTIEWKSSENNPKYVDNQKEKESPAFDVKFFEDAEGKTAATDLSKAKYAKIVFANAAQYIDGETYTQTAAITNKNGNTLMTLSISAKKVLPTAPSENIVKAGQLDGDVYRCYLLPDGKELAQWDATNAATVGTMAMKYVLNLGDEAEKYGISFGTTDQDNDGKYTQPKPATPTDFTLSVAPELIDNETAHTTTITYDFGNISTYKKANGTWVVGDDYKPTVKTFKTIYCDILNDKIMSWKAVHQTQKDKNGNLIGAYTEYKPEIAYGQATTLSFTIFRSDNKVNKTALGNGYQTKTLNDLKKCYNFTSAEVLSDESGKADYFKAEPVAEGIKLTLKSNTTNPIKDVPSTLILKGTDVFGKTVTIKFAVIVKKQ